MPNRRESSEDLPRPVDDSQLAKLAEMGYPVEMARNALIITRNNLEEAVNILVSNTDE